MTEETSTTEDVVMHEANLSETEEGEYVSGEEAEEIERTEDHEEEGAGSTVFSRHVGLNEFVLLRKGNVIPTYFTCGNGSLGFSC